MESLLVAVGMLLGSGVVGLVASRLPRLSAGVAAAGAVSACVVGIVPAARVLLGGPSGSLRLVWGVPTSPFSVGLDPLSAFFLVPIFVLSALAAIYGAAYMQSYREKKSLGAPAFFFNLLVAGMVVVAIARHGFVFLMAWELMSLAAYFLVTFEHERDDVCRAGWVYLVATHLGAAFLFALFMLLGREAGSLKGLMFFAAGSVLHGTGTKDIERLGGVMKRMPRTGAAMIVGAVAIAGLPPLNGFVSEWLMYMGLMRGGMSHQGASRATLLLSVGTVAIIGGLALTCFVRIIGMVLLGEARSDDARHAHESSVWLLGPMGLLAMLCVSVALFPGVVVSFAGGVAEQVLGVPQKDFSRILNSAGSPLGMLGIFNAGAWAAIGLAAAWLAVLRRGSVEAQDATWGCGYARPTPRMQYTGASFAEFVIARVLPKSLRLRTTTTAPAGLFPAGGKLSSEYPDPLSERVYEPFFARWAERFAWLRWLQQGQIHLYLLYFLVVLVLAFGWVSLRAWMTS